MALTAASIMTLVGRNLSDEDAVRWTLPELCGWINEAVKAIILAKPSACASQIALSLQAGTLQAIGTGNLALLRLVRNLTSAGPPRVGGRIITPTSRETLDAQEPYWHDPSKVRYRKEARQFVYDEENPLNFYVYPGNDGTGLVEALVSKLPTAIAASGDPALLASYEQDVGLQELYQPPILDYVLFRALSKDDTVANATGATMHYQAFATAIGLKIQVEGSNSPNSRARVQA